MNEAKAAYITRLVEDINNILDKLYDESLAYAAYRESITDYYDPEFDDYDKITDIPRIRHMMEDLLGTWKALVAQCDFNKEAAAKAVGVDLKEIRKYLD